MSRIGRMPIAIPAGVTVEVNGNKVTAKGPKGELTQEMHPDMIIEVEGNEVLVKRPSEDKLHKSLHGLTRTLVHNMVYVEPVDGITIEAPAPNKIVISGLDKQLVGQFAADVRKKRPPEPYKGKGIRYTGEVIRRKEGKTGAKKKYGEVRING